MKVYIQKQTIIFLNSCFFIFFSILCTIICFKIEFKKIFYVCRRVVTEESNVITQYILKYILYKHTNIYTCKHKFIYIIYKVPTRDYAHNSPTNICTNYFIS